MPVDRGGFSFSGQKLAAVLERLVKDTAEPVPFTVDHGTEFTSISLEEWSYRRGIRLDFTRPGKPTDNGHIESFNGRLRDECLDVNQIASLEDAAEKIESWRLDYMTSHFTSSTESAQPQVLQLVQFESTVEATQHFGVLTTLTTFHLMASYRGCRHGT
jgi:putative transposase